MSYYLVTVDHIKIHALELSKPNIHCFPATKAQRNCNGNKQTWRIVRFLSPVRLHWLRILSGPSGSGSLRLARLVNKLAQVHAILIKDVCAPVSAHNDVTSSARRHAHHTRNTDRPQGWTKPNTISLQNDEPRSHWSWNAMMLKESPPTH